MSILVDPVNSKANQVKSNVGVLFNFVTSRVSTLQKQVFDKDVLAEMGKDAGEVVWILSKLANCVNSIKANSVPEAPDSTTNKDGTVVLGKVVPPAPSPAPVK